MELTPYRVVACNLAKSSENKMHDDTVARQYGFIGGLVPGVDVFAYMSHVPAKVWGRLFLERGWMEGHFLKPVYDGETVEVTAREADGGLAIELRSRGELCGTATAKLPRAAPTVRLDDFAAVEPVAKRLPVDGQTYRPGSWLGIVPYRQDVAERQEYLSAIHEAAPVYAAEAVLHPGTLLRTLNSALKENVILGPWIHVSSALQHLTTAFAGDELTVRAKVADNYERKGHRFVELDVLVLADEAPAAHVRHVAIYRPRQLAGAA